MAPSTPRALDIRGRYDCGICSFRAAAKNYGALPDFNAMRVAKVVWSLLVL